MATVPMRFQVATSIIYEVDDDYYLSMSRLSNGFLDMGRLLESPCSSGLSFVFRKHPPLTSITAVLRVAGFLPAFLGHSSCITR
jgi:hypothetical protein